MKTWKKVLALVLALSMVIPGVALGGSEGKEVQAVAGTESVNGVVLPANQVNTDGAIPTPNVEEYKGWLFAGWFKNSNCTLDDVPENEGEKLFAKFVPADVLSTKAQATKADSGNDVIRFVSSVESLNYSKVGFEVSWKGAEKPLKNTSSTVYKKIKTSTQGADYEFGPKVMDIESEYFITAKMDLKAEPFSKIENVSSTDFLVRAFWITLDGTPVYGASRCVSLNDGRGVGDTVNMSFELADGLKADTLEKDDVEEGEDPYVDLYANSTDTTEIITVDGRTVHVRVSTDKTALKSATYFEFTKDEEGKEVVGSTVYRNLYTVYDGVNGDRSWYDAYVKDAGESDKTDFIIATNADLYGFAEIVNATEAQERDSFSGKTVYLVADIAANEGTASASGWTGKTNDLWTAIGNTTGKAFQGTFDGDSHTISGVYGKKETSDGKADTSNMDKAFGLFGYTSGSTIKNLRLENSYLYSKALGLGSVVGLGDGNLINVYSSASLESNSVQVGGIIGRIQNPINTSAVTNSNITNCWYDGEMTLTATSTSVNAGGLVGTVQIGTLKVDNSLFTGTITATKGSPIGGLQGSQATASTKAEYTNCASIGTLSSSVAGATFGRAQKQSIVGSSVYITKKYDVYGTPGGGLTDADLTQLNPTRLDFTAPGNFAVAEKALNVNVANNNNNKSTDVIWDTWEEYNGQLVLQSLDPQETIVVTSNTDWYDKDKSSYVLWDAADLYGLAELSTGNRMFAGKTITLAASIKVNHGDAKTWADTAPENKWETPICSIGYPFRGTFDGAGHTISGIYMKNESSYTGLFSVIDQAKSSGITYVGTVQNLRLENSYFEHEGTSDAYMGSIAGQSGGIFRDVYSDAILVSSGAQVGGLTGRLNYNNTTAETFNTYTVENCWFNGEIRMTGDSGKNAGGIAGNLVRGTANITNCLNSGVISSKLTSDVRIGGICGITAGSSSLNITNCVNAGAFEIVNGATDCIGAILGRNGDSCKPTFTNTYRTGDSYQTNTIGGGDTKNIGDAGTAEYIDIEKSEENASNLITNLGKEIWIIGTVNGKKMPVLISLQDVLD